MAKQDDAELFRAYLGDVKKTHGTRAATEHSYRPALMKLIEGFSEKDIDVINEAQRGEFGAPDLIVQGGDVPVGHVECKDIGKNLDHEERNEQLERYKAGLPNLILTDYLEFRWYEGGERRLVARLGRVDTSGNVVADEDGEAQVAELLRAFLAAEAQTIRNSKDLARLMAAKARLLRDGTREILRREDRVERETGEPGPVRGMLESYREVLIADLDDEKFADMQAQTVAYGLFAARCVHGNDPNNGKFTRKDALFAETAPFLRELFGRMAGPDADPRIVWIVDDLAGLLDRVDMAAILNEFGGRGRGNDPVVHFYEDFLRAYDPDLRELRGVYYTPEPVVGYIVRSIDHLLRDTFGIKDGLADDTKRDDDGGPRVLILDPAVGTGTFLREVVAHIRSTLDRKRLSGAWGKYVRDHLLHRLFGFELMVAPYAVCHLKLALEMGLPDGGLTMPAGQRLGVFLTNALEEAHDKATDILFAPEIAVEASSANSVKLERPVMVVLGNPPYSGESANKGKWIKDLLRGKDGGRDTGSYFHVGRQHIGEKNPKWLNDDYVKFMRFAQWRIERTGEGVLGFVTNHAYLDSPTFRGVRWSLMEAFDEIYVLNLHGNTNRKEKAPDGGKDDNVFDIKQGVAIGIFVKHGGSGQKPAKVFHADLWGPRETKSGDGKYDLLKKQDVSTTKWDKIEPVAPGYWFVPRDRTLAGEYHAGPGVNEIFKTQSVAITTARDHLAVRFTEQEMQRVVSDFRERETEDARAYYQLGEDVEDWRVAWAQEDLKPRRGGEAPGEIRNMLYRPFDRRFTYYTGTSRGFICRPRDKVMRHMLVGENLGLSTTRSIEIAKGWEHAFVSRDITQHHTVSLKEVNYLFPLYTYMPDGCESFGRPRAPNLCRNFIEDVREAVGLDFVEDGGGNLTRSFGPDDVFHYIYAVLYSPAYRVRYAEFLRSDYPRIQLTESRELFRGLVRLGKTLASLHLMDTEGSKVPGFPVDGDGVVGDVRYEEKPGRKAKPRVWINDEQYFEGVPPDAWDYTIGGYQPARRWLKDRTGRTLEFEDIRCYMRICATLAETIRVEKRIDKLIDKHGGWPLGSGDGAAVG